MNSDYAIGIDLGTTFSCVSVWKNNRVEILANEFSNRITPSCVAFTDKERLIGEVAKAQLLSNQKNTITNVKNNHLISDKDIKSAIAYNNSVMYIRTT